MLPKKAYAMGGTRDFHKIPCQAMVDFNDKGANHSIKVAGLLLLYMDSCVAMLL